MRSACHPIILVAIVVTISKTSLSIKINNKEGDTVSKRTNGIDKYVQCPYYKWKNRGRISCEGITDENTTNLIFGDENKAREYLDDYCCSIYGMHRCLIYNMLNGKYGVKDV